MKDTYRIMMVAGEPSGDGHAAKLVNALRNAEPSCAFEFFGSAGPKMRDAGVEAVVKADDLAIMGIPEIAKAMPVFVSAFRGLKAAAAVRKPDIVVLIDFPEFNLKLAKSLKKSGLRVIYYISPQLWGWRKYRRRTIRKYVDLLMSILPFEKDWYARHGIRNVEFVGSPLVNEVRPLRSREEFRTTYSIDESTPLIALLPGSRHKELVRILPPMLEAASLMEETDRRLHFVIALAATRRRAEIEAAMDQVRRAGTRIPENILVVQDEAYDALNASDAAAVASGTATLEAGIIGTPMAVVYKTSSFNYKLIRPLIKIDHFALINLIAGERIVSEMIQDDFTPRKLATELFRILEPGVNTGLRSKLDEAAGKLGPGGASTRAAVEILKLLEANKRD